ncbi:MAG: Smr/MutS family protein [Burkholderiales bacterium]|jgi:DNA-nicking Smr family endonuclease|nr:Smr/MutS family protein [Burkholderiales bacterium]
MKNALSDLKTLWLHTQREARAEQPKTTATKTEARQQSKPLPPKTPLPVRKKTARRESEHKREHDIDFQRKMRDEDVAPLPPLRRAVIETSRPAPVPKQRLRDETEVLALAKYGESPSPTTWEIGQELEDDQTFLRIGLSPDVLRKLRRGQWAIQSELDLHGMVVDEAHDALVDFLVEARSRGLRCVRIIHGKGLTSPGKAPVLKGKVRHWLALWDDVLAYCEPAHHAGGGGAVVVLLRGR